MIGGVVMIGINQAIHKVFDSNIYLRPYLRNERFSWYYAEDKLYMIFDSKTEATCIIEAENPNAALKKVLSLCEE